METEILTNRGSSESNRQWNDFNFFCPHFSVSHLKQASRADGFSEKCQKSRTVRIAPLLVFPPPKKTPDEPDFGDRRRDVRNLTISDTNTHPSVSFVLAVSIRATSKSVSEGGTGRMSI